MCQLSCTSHFLTHIRRSRRLLHSTARRTRSGACSFDYPINIFRLLHRHPFATNAHTLNVVQDATSGPNAPDVEMIGACVAFLKHGSEVAPAGANIFTIFPILLCPQSIGYLKLKSSSPWDKPIIDPKYVLCYICGYVTDSLSSITDVFLTPMIWRSC